MSRAAKKPKKSRAVTGVGSIGLVRHHAWGALWRSHNNTDGIREHLLHENLLPVLFKTRAQARRFIAEKYGYIKQRDDLRREPHGWRMPIAVRVVVTPNGEAQARAK